MTSHTIHDEQTTPVPRSRASQSSQSPSASHCDTLPYSLTGPLPHPPFTPKHDRNGGSQSTHDNVAIVKNSPSVSAPLRLGAPPSTPRASAQPLPCVATPGHASSQDSEHTFTKIGHIQQAVQCELANSWVEEEGKAFQAHLEAIIDTKYPDLDAKIQSWLNGYEDYSNAKAWTCIPSNARKEDRLYEPIVQVMNDILTEFQPPDQEKERARAAIDTHKKPFVHNNPNPADATATDETADETNDTDETDSTDTTDATASTGQTTLNSSPDITTFGNGPAATGKSYTIAYAFALNVWEIKLRLSEKLSQNDRDQVAVYAREIFIQQPNRRFVYTPLLSKRELRVIRFDRAGCYYTHKINYHEQAKFFVKLVLLVASFDEELIGYDTTVYWANEKRFLSMCAPVTYHSGTQDWKANSTEMLFDLEDRPMFSRHTIRSRGTVCWSASYGGNTYIIKDYWRADGREIEADFLKELVGVRGVGQMFAFENDRESIKEARGFNDESDMHSDSTTRTTVLGRSFMRIVVHRHGSTLEQAHSPLVLLRAIRDIVLGHRESFLERGILHRDISFNNLLLSAKLEHGAGVIIDWDMARRLIDLLSGTSTTGDARTGTRAFQSVKVLLGSPQLGHHDHMDDLESIFYVLYYILYGYDTAGRRLPDEKLGRIAKWENLSTEPGLLAESKGFFIQNDDSQELTRFDGPYSQPLCDLTEGLQKFFRPRIALANGSVGARRRTTFPPYQATQAKIDYENFLDHIDLAITKIESLPPSTPLPSPIPFSLHGFPSPPSPGKRVHDDNDDATGDSPHSPSTKRPRRGTSASDPSTPTRRSTVPINSSPLRPPPRASTSYGGDETRSERRMTITSDNDDPFQSHPVSVAPAPVRVARQRVAPYMSDATRETFGSDRATPRNIYGNQHQRPPS
ncbi:hypothetical protein R3P38DRAFT_2508887 [Favolaschia claudopus]|uniref:Fungal-type protein kinase domain-containing protein n=1 Tax=Favolaschia claudopus TaxID=2862362 RepID=A0AAW0CXI4_9AGAR